MPYTTYYHQLPWRGIRDQDIFRYRMWLVHFWECEIHLPERVYRQFGLFQLVPPLAPLPFDYLEGIRSMTRAQGLDRDDGFSADWNTHWAEHIATQPCAIGEPGPYDVDRYVFFLNFEFGSSDELIYSNWSLQVSRVY